MNTLQPKTAIRVSQLKNAIDAYQHDQPLIIHLKNFFRQNRQMGSKDRKQLSTWMFSWYRLGHWLMDLPFEKRLALALCFTDDQKPETLDLLASMGAKFNDRNQFIDQISESHQTSVSKGQFDYTPNLSSGIESPDYSKYLMKQPKVWLNVFREAEQVKEELKSENIEYIWHNGDVIELDPNQKITQLKSFQEGRVSIQDLSSQETAQFFKAESSEFWWDCCCGAGGKSMLFMHQNKTSQLLATDNRASILENFAERMEQYDLQNFAFKKVDLLKPISKAFPSFNGIIADVPCTGSGTWARSPEQIMQASQEKTLEYQQLQRTIIENTIPYLRVKGKLVYITCSVFEEENEANVAHFLANYPLELTNQVLLNGTQRGSDNMFCAVFTKLEA